MLNIFEDFISDFSQNGEPGDYWSDYAILDGINILKNFSNKDWISLLKLLPEKTLFWKKRLAECLGDLNTPYELKVLLELLNSDNVDLFLVSVDALRSLDLSKINILDKRKLLNKAQKSLNSTTSKVNKLILQGFIRIIDIPS